MILFVSPVTAREVPDIVESSTTVVANVEDVETCIRYVRAPAVVFQLKFVATGIPVAPSNGVASTGTLGAATIVVKLRIGEYALAPLALDALTRQ